MPIDQSLPTTKIKGLAFATALVTLVVSLSLAVMPFTSASNVNVGGPSDCDNNAIIRCGVHSANDLINNYRNSAYVRGVYGAFGISAADINGLSDNVVSGTVTKQGDVFADGQLVARNAVTGGRQNMAGSTRVNANGAVFFRRPPSVSFVSSSLPAFVVMNNGRFQFAVIASCGNAVTATPTTPPKHHKPPSVAPARPVSKPKPQKPVPAAAPTQVQSQAQVQQVSQSQQVTVENKSTPAPAPAAQPTAVAAAPVPVAPTTLPNTGSGPSPTVTLPNTGPGDIIGLFSGSSALGFLGYRRFLLRKIG